MVMSHSVIQLLPDHIANQIAAGEVIQRPSSVVKELVENAIDAGANSIEVHIKDAGRTLIQVSDNGSGMSEPDAMMCFERHATSKLKSADELFNLQTKGFRGEALASIAAIAHVDLRTKQSEDEIGTHVIINGSKVEEVVPDVCKDGTSFQVKNLFFNVPARRNFLKSDKVEFKHILNEFERIAIPHSQVEFKLVHNNETIYSLPISNLKQRLTNMFGKSSENKWVPLKEETDIVGLSGFIGKPEFAKKSRGEQYFFVNNRFFKSSHFHHAVSKAYSDLLKPDTHASYVLFFDVDPTKLDVNVHPTKTEIKFEEDRLIYAILHTAIKNSLGKYNVMPTLDFEAEMSFDVPAEVRKSIPREPEIKTSDNYNPFQSTSKPANSGVSSGQSKAIRSAGFEKEINQSWTSSFSDLQIDEEQEDEQQSLQADVLLDRQWMIQSPYIVTGMEKQFVYVHYRRAYERIVYEELMRTFISNPIPSQGMLFPIHLDMNKKEQELWKENESLLKQFGLDWNMEGECIEITAVPVVLPEDRMEPFLSKLVDQMEHAQIERGELAHHFLLSLSKAAGMKKGLVKNIEMAQDIIERLTACEDQNYSPAGLKIKRTLSFEQLETL